MIIKNIDRKMLKESKISGKTILLFSYKETKEYTGDSIERLTEEDQYYDSDKILHRVLVTAALDGITVGSAVIAYTSYTDENGDDVIIDDENDEAYLERIDVEDDYQNRGIGTELLKQCLKKVYNLGLSASIVLAPDNRRAKQWYEKIGTEIHDDYWSAVDQGYGVYRIRKSDLC